MKNSIAKNLALFGLLLQANIYPISMVYNFRMAEITREPIVEDNDRNHTLVALFFDQWREKYNKIFQNFVGGLGSFIYDFGSNYFRTDFALSHIKEKQNGITTVSDTETDDILFTIGHNFIITDKASITLSELLGIPTHKIYRLQHTDFGYNQVGLGIQLDGLYSFNSKGTVVYGARYIYFIRRSALDNTCQDHIFSIGNVGDLLFGYKKNWNRHGLELGYSARSRFGAHVCPPYNDIVKKTNYVRSNFYFVYKYKFMINNILNRLLVNLSYGFDHKPKNYGNKHIVTLWTSWNVNF